MSETQIEFCCLNSTSLQSLFLLSECMNRFLLGISLFNVHCVAGSRRGALQSVLILREYKECYDALVEALERNGSLGDCIYAIENAALKYNKEPLRIPLGYISEEGQNEAWTKIIPNDSTIVTASEENVPESIAESEDLNTEQSLEKLREYKEALTSRIKDIDGKLEEL